MPVRLSVLFIEKEDAEVEPLLCELRQAGFEPHWDRMASSARYLAALSREPEIILASYAATPLSAVRALELLHAQGLTVPLIVIGESGDEQLVVDCMKRGAADYVHRDRIAWGRPFNVPSRSSIDGMSGARAKHSEMPTCARCARQRRGTGPSSSAYRRSSISTRLPRTAPSSM